MTLSRRHAAPDAARLSLLERSSALKASLCGRDRNCFEVFQRVGQCTHFG
jgi:hypothetical protein